jgi:hypothetical protein
MPVSGIAAIASAQRVGGGDLPVGKRVVDDRREEVHGLHERRAARPTVDPRVIGSAEVDDHVRIGLRRQVVQHARQLAGGKLARAAGARDQFGEIGHRSQL